MRPVTPNRAVPVPLGVLAIALAIGSTPPARAADPALAPGAILELYDLEEGPTAIPRLEAGALPNAVRVIETIDLAHDRASFEPVGERYFCSVRGRLRIPRQGRYGFRLISDDGSRFSVGAEVWIDHDGAHGATGKDGEGVLSRGTHEFRIEHFDAGGASSLRLEWRPPGARTFTLAPAELFRHDPASIGPTEPGMKRIAPEVAPTEGMRRDVAVARAIDLGADWLLSQVEGRQVFEEVNVKDKSAQVAFETYALIVAGLAVDHPVIAANFAHLEGRVERRNYSYGVCSEIFARDAAIAQIEEDRILASPGIDPRRIVGHPSIGREHRRRIADLAEGLLAAQNAEGGWHYFPQERTADISCTQFVTLALAIAERRGVRIDPKVWRQAGKYLLSLQETDGPVTGKRVALVPRERRGGAAAEEERGEGTAVDPNAADRAITGGEGIEVRVREFEYSPGHPIAMAGNRWNRVCSGTSSLMLVRERVGDRIPGDERAAIDRGIRDGLGWMLEHWGPFDSYYGIYSLEKVGDIGHVERFDGRDWYDEVATWLLAAQRSDGSWPKTGMWGESPRVSTAFALLVLRRATSLLTTSSVDRIVETGEGASPRSARTIEWVYLPEFETSLHWPELARVLTLRPRRATLKVIATVVEACEAPRRGALVPALVDIHERAGDRASRKLLDGALETILGHPPGSAAECRAWFAAWRRAVEIAEGETAPEGDEVLVLYQHERGVAASAPLREAVVRAALRHDVRDLVPALLVDLDHEEREVRRVAHLGLRGFFPGLPEYDPAASATKRKGQAEAVREFVAD